MRNLYKIRHNALLSKRKRFDKLIKLCKINNNLI